MWREGEGENVGEATEGWDWGEERRTLNKRLIAESFPKDQRRLEKVVELGVN